MIFMPPALPAPSPGHAPEMVCHAQYRPPRECVEAIMLEVDERREIVSRESTLTSGEKSEGANRDLVPSTAPASGPVAPRARGCFATSDLNDLYRRVVDRNNRLRRLIKLRAPEIIVRNERRMLQEAVETLFDHGEIVEIIAHIGISILATYFNYIAETEIHVPLVDLAPASHAT